jgi:hypothetical protein
VEVMRPEPGQTISDPACGTGSFLLAAHDYIAGHYPLDRDQWRSLNHDAIRFWVISQIFSLWLFRYLEPSAPIFIARLPLVVPA